MKISLSILILFFCSLQCISANKIILSKKTSDYSLVLKEVKPDPNKVCTVDCKSCQLQEVFSDGYKLNEVNIEQLFIYALGINYEELDMDFTSAKFFEMEYHTKNKSQSDSLMISELLKHFNIKMNVIEDKHIVNYIAIDNNELLERHKGNYYGSGAMILENGEYIFTDYFITSMAGLLTNNSHGDFILKSRIPADDKYCITIKKSRKLEEIELSLKAAGLKIETEEKEKLKYQIRKV